MSFWVVFVGQGNGEGEKDDLELHMTKQTWLEVRKKK